MKVIEKYESKFIELLKEMEAEIGADGIKVIVESSIVSPLDTAGSYSYRPIGKTTKRYQFHFDMDSLPRVEVL